MCAAACVALEAIERCAATSAATGGVCCRRLQRPASATGRVVRWQRRVVCGLLAHPRVGVLDPACWWLTGRRSRWQRNASSRRGCCGRRCVLRMPAVWVWWCCLWRVPCRRWRTVVLAPVVGCCAPAGRAVSALGAAGGGQALVADRRGGLGAQRRRERLLVGVVGRAGFAPTAVLVRSRRDTVGTGEARLTMLRASAAARMLWRPQRRWLGLCAP